MKTLAFFNNKGGVGKTTLLYHLAWMFVDMGKRVLVADMDPQANLTSMFLTEPQLEKLWDPDNAQGQTVMAPLTPILKGIGDIGSTPFQQISTDLRLVPGDLNLSNFESNLSEAWGKCLNRQEPAFRITSSLYRIVRQAAESFEADLVLVDVGPNFGAINRAALISADAVVIPVAPDLFSIQGLRNLGPTLATWRREWKIRLEQDPAVDLLLPEAIMEPLGYVVLQFGIRDNRPVSAYDKWARRIPSAGCPFESRREKKTPIAWVCSSTIEACCRWQWRPANPFFALSRPMARSAPTLTVSRIASAIFKRWPFEFLNEFTQVSALSWHSIVN